MLHLTAKYGHGYKRRTTIRKHAFSTGINTKPLVTIKRDDTKIMSRDLTLFAMEDDDVTRFSVGH